MEKRNLNNIVYFFVENDKFKTNAIKLCFKEKTKSEDVIKRQSLPKILLDKTQKYDDKLKLRRHLNLLYSTSLSIKEIVVGQYSVLTFTITYIQGKYLEEDITNEAIDLLKEVAYNPYTKNNKFDDKTITRIKNELKNLLKHKEKSYSLKAKEGAMIETYGNQVINQGIITKEKVESLNNQDLYDYYQQVLKTNEMSIIFEGDKDIYDSLSSFKSDVINKNEYTLPSVKASKKDLIITKDKTKQNNIFLIYDNFSKEREDVFKNSLFSMVLGEIPSSLLFQEVREKNSLAYSIGSGFDNHYKVLCIAGGVKLTALDQTLEIINQIFERLKTGDIANILNDAKTSYINSFKAYTDNRNAIASRVLSQWAQNHFRTIEDSIEEIKKVTVEDIKEIANRIEHKITYVLQGEIKNEN